MKLMRELQGTPQVLNSEVPILSGYVIVILISWTNIWVFEK